MKTIGLIGGMSWESSQTYYRHLIQGEDTDVPLFDSTAIHAKQAVEAALVTLES
ncbi:hypothetical protein ACR80S_10425 [Halomonas sp. MA07-2]|uniref:hypothetical protein n=1 Tax=Halomonas sp. MA07-2 TaxID=3440841 RepID=UPI003EEB23AF